MLEKNPCVIFKYESTQEGHRLGCDIDSPSKAKEVVEEILRRSELADVCALKSKKVYGYSMFLNLGTVQPVGALYTAKILHPDRFKDIDPRDVFQELVSKYFGSDFDIRKHGIYAYPCPWEKEEE